MERLERWIGSVVFSAALASPLYVSPAYADPPKKDESTLNKIISGMTGSAVGAVTPQKTAEEYVNEGRRAYLRQDYKTAVELYDNAISIDSSLDTARYRKGEALCMTGDFENAQKEFECIREENLRTVGLSLWKISRKEYVAAERDLETIRDITGLSMNVLGFALQAQGRNSEAKEAYLKGMELDGTLSEIPHNYGYLLAKEGKIAEAIDWAKKALAIEPENITARYGLAKNLSDFGRIQEAKVELQEILRINPNYEKAKRSYAVLSSR